MNLKNVRVFLEYSSQQSLSLDFVLWVEILSDWKVFRGTDFVIFLSQAAGIELEISLPKRNLFFSPSKSWEPKEMTPMLKILLFPLWTISVQLKRTFPVGPLPDLMGTEIRKWCGQNSPWTNCFQSTKPQSSWQSHFFFLPRFIFFTWVTDLSLINSPARISAVLFSNLYFFPPFLLGGGNRVCERSRQGVCKVSLSETPCILPISIAFHLTYKYHRATMKFLKMCFFPSLMAFYTFLLALLFHIWK